jgi:hypothetical protein
MWCAPCRREKDTAWFFFDEPRFPWRVRDLLKGGFVVTANAGNQGLAPKGDAETVASEPRGAQVPFISLLAAAFAEFWHAKWPHQTRDVAKLEKSMHYTHCREAFFAGVQAANAPDKARLQPSPEAGRAAIDHTICHNASCHAPKHNCCVANLCEAFETLQRIRPNAALTGGDSRVTVHADVGTLNQKGQ